MRTIRHAVIVACTIFAGALAGDILQWLLPAHSLSDARGVINAVQGLVTTLLALVGGLLIWTSFGVYAQQQSEATTLGTQLIQLDVLLDRLGPAAARGRMLLAQELTATRKRFWGNLDGGAPPMNYALARTELARFEDFFMGLTPANDVERGAIEQGRSLADSIVETHLLMGRQLQNPLPNALINSVVLWAVLVFFCVGLGATLNELTVIFELLGAVSLAGAIFIMLEFSQPYVGHFRIPPTRIDEAISALSAKPGP